MTHLKEAHHYFQGKSYWTIPTPPKSHFIRIKLHPHYQHYSIKEFNKIFKSEYDKNIPLFDDVPLDEFLLYPQHQQYFFENFIEFFEQPFTFYTFLYEIKHIEKKLIENYFLDQNHSFFQQLIEHLDFITPKDKKDVLLFCTMMFLEDNSIHPHWNFKHQLEITDINEIITLELSQHITGLNFLLDVFSTEELTRPNIILDKTPYKQSYTCLNTPINIKDYYMSLFLNEKIPLKKYDDFISKLDTCLDIPYHLDTLANILKNNNTPIYHLYKLNIPEFNTFEVVTNVNKIDTTISVELLCKFNTMSKTLSKLIGLTNNHYPYAGLDEERIFNIEDAIEHFSQDKQLLPYMIEFIQLKAKKALSNDIKAKWRYFHLMLTVHEENEKTAPKFKI